MRAFYSMKPTEFLEQVRDALIAVKAGPLVIDQCDALKDAIGKEAEVERLEGELYEMEEQRDEMKAERDHYRTALQCLLNDMQDYATADDPNVTAFDAALKDAQTALDEKF